MMDSMRNAAKGWAAKVLIGLLVVSFGVWGIADWLPGASRSPLATVGDTDITADEFSRAFQQYLQNLARQTGQGLTPEDARRLGMDRAVLNNLIQSAALDNEAQKLNLAVPDTYLATKAMENPAFHDSSGKFDPELFRQLLEQNGLNEAVFFAQERQGLVREALTGTADGNLAFSNTLVEAAVRHRDEQRDARYFAIRTADTEVAAPTDDEIKKEYEANPASYTAPEYRAIAVMKVEPADIAAKMTVTEDELRQGYERYKSDYFTPEKRTILQLSFPTLEEAQAAHARLAGGEDFLALAKERGFSEQDVTFADRARSDFFDPAIAEAAFRLNDGQLSDPIKGALATVILKAVKITPEHQSTLEEARAQLEPRLKSERAREEIQSIYDAVEDARAAQTSFEDIAGKAGIPFQLIALTDARGRDKAGNEIEMPHKAELLNAAFSSDVGLENDAISLDEGYVWYEIREVVPSAVRPLEEVKDQARAAVVTAKARDLSDQKAKKLVERLKSGAKLEELATEAGTTVETAQGLKRNESNDTFSPAAMAAVFSVPEGGYTYAVEPDGRGAKIMQSQAVLLPAFDPNAQEARQVRERLEQQASADMLTAYLSALQAEAGVTVNETLWRQISGTTQ